MRASARLGPYELTELLGQGGMGAVFRARHAELGVERAIKTLTGALSPTRVERFMRETQVLARVDHPNVVRIHESGQDPQTGNLYYVMDLVDGEPLNEVTDRGRLAWHVAVDVAIGVCDGVAALHDVGVVHRDLKPPNVVLGPDGPVVLDLGLARDVEQAEVDRLTQTGALMGTPLYMAPEQQSGSSVTPATDVYALGLIAHELVSGYRVSDSGVLPGFQAPPSPSSLDGSLPRAIDAVIERALSPDPTDRYASAGELAAALREVRDRPGFSRRTLRLAWVTATVLGVVLVGWLAVRYAPRPVPQLPQVSGPIRPTAVPLLDAKPGRDALRELKRTPDAKRRHAQLEAWLERYPTHPDRDEAQALLRDARRSFPLAVLFRDGGAAQAVMKGAGAFLSPNEVLGSWSGGLTWRWTVAPRALTGTWRHEHPGVYAGRFALAPDRRTLALGGTDRLRLFDLQRPGVERSRPAGLEGLSDAVCWIDERTLATSQGSPATITLLRLVPGGVRSIGTVGPHKGAVTSIAVSDDGRYLASAAFLDSVATAMGRTAFYLWDLKTRTLVWVQPMLSRARCVRFLPRTHTFLGGTSVGRLAVFGPARRGALGEFSGPKAHLRLDGGRNAHLGRVMDLALSPDGSILYSVGTAREDRDGGELRVWSVAERRQLRPTLHHPVPIVGVAVSPDGERLLLSTRAGFELWDASVDPK